MKKFSRKLVALFAVIILQSSLGTKAELVEAKSFGQNGYKKYSDGMLIQFGTVSQTSYSGFVTVYLPVSFINEGYTSLVTPDADSSPSLSYHIKNASKTKSTLGLYRIFTNTSGEAGGASVGFSWFAIGRWK